jgi:hypothetical protein
MLTSILLVIAIVVAAHLIYAAFKPKTIISMDKMVGGEFAKDLASLKTIAEAK